MFPRMLSRFLSDAIERVRELPADLSPKRFWRWIRREPPRFRAFRRLAIFLVLVAIIAIVTPRAVQRWKGWQSQRLANEALGLIEQREWTLADRKIRDAIAMRATEPKVLLATARLLSRTGQRATAIDCWRRIGGSPLLTAVDHRDYAATALAVNELDTATEEIDFLMSQKSGPLPQDLVLAAQLALARGLNASAGRYAEKVLNDSRSTSQDVVGAAALVFQTGALDGPSRAVACDRLTTLARNTSDPVALDALTLLAKQPLTSSPSATIFAAPSTKLCNGGITLSEVADLLENHPSARGCHHILAYDIDVRLDPSKRDGLVAEAINSYGTADDETLIVLAAWLNSQRQFDAELKVVSAERASTNRELFGERVDALSALGKLAEAEELLLSESSVMDPAAQHMRLAVIKSKAGESVGSANEWDRALDNAQSVQQLLVLAKYAERNRAFEIADTAYDRVVIKQSNLRSAYIARLMLLETMDQTAKAHAVALKITQRWPNDLASRMHEVYLRLLLDDSSEVAKTAEESAKTVLQQNPWHLGARMVLALAQLRLGRSADALDAVSAAPCDQPASVPPLAVRVAALTANGWKDKAVEEAQKLAAVKLLPEERALMSALGESRN